MWPDGCHLECVVHKFICIVKNAWPEVNAFSILIGFWTVHVKIGCKLSKAINILHIVNCAAVSFN